MLMMLNANQHKLCKHINTYKNSELLQVLTTDLWEKQTEV